MAFWSKFKKNPEADDPLLKQEPGMSSLPVDDVGSTATHESEPGFGYESQAGAPSNEQVPPVQPTQTSPQQGYPTTPPPQQEVAEPPFMTHRTRERPVPAFTRRAMEQTSPRAPNPIKHSAYSETSEQIANADLEYKNLRRRRARRRFVGAAMLLALVLVILPFIFDKMPPPPDQLVPIGKDIPNPDSVNVGQIRIPGTPPQVLAEAEKMDAQEEAAQQEAPKHEAEPAHPQKETPPPKEAKPEQKTQQAKQEPPPPESQTTASGQYFIQLLATRDLKRAEGIKKTMQDAKIPCYLEKVAVKGGDVWRVRVGPFTTEKVAEEARGQVGFLGYPATVQRAK